MMRRGRWGVAGAAGVLAAAAVAGVAGAENQGPGGGGVGTDTRGYEFVTPNQGPTCLQMDDDIDRWVTAYCNYHSPAQRFTANRGGGYTYLKNNNGKCFGSENITTIRGTRAWVVLVVPCSGTAAVWRRTTSSEWASHDDPGACLTGYRDEGFHLTLEKCASRSNQQWKATG